ncbi:MAG: 1-deoxy-D-xylulose-5-phosphate reductoisomerase [Coriobacteriia bacterium]|nr:1-deoxy-D-xylulose-5-phosphate reductoisomerase [Coriobacteriia bacterium]
MSEPLRVAVLGSTGSIGRQAIEVAAAHPQQIKIVSLAAASSADMIIEQARELGVRTIALANEDAADRVRDALPGHEVASGAAAVAELAARDDVDVVLNALVGSSGLRVTIEALKAGHTLALANKESLVVGGPLVTALAEPDQLVPVDSEHSAIHQCLVGEDERDVSRIWLTASGGPFRGLSRSDLVGVTPSQALAHPTWNMGQKISIDSATLMNKGLEVIEAHHLFGTPYPDIRVVLHPQSCVHSMVEFTDGSVKAHLGATDMRIPIQYALSMPRRWAGPIEPVDFALLGRLDFADPDLDTFRCLVLAFEAGRIGGTMPAAMNAANEIAVASFLEGRCAFLDIERTVDAVMTDHHVEALSSVEQIEMVDAWARSAATSSIAAL